MNTTPPAKPPQSAAKTHAQRALEKLGLLRDIDFALHLPLRYEDETHITALRDARHGETVQIEAVVTHSEIQTRGKRQLVVTVRDQTDECQLRFFNFYPSHQRTLAVGERLWIRGELKRSLVGLSMLHPSFKPAVGELTQVLIGRFGADRPSPLSLCDIPPFGGNLGDNACARIFALSRRACSCESCWANSSSALRRCHAGCDLSSSVETDTSGGG